MLDIEKMKKEMKEWAISKKGKAYFRNLNEQEEILKKRYKRFEKWLETNDFDKLIHRLILEHGDEWYEKCSDSGCEVYPNNKLGFIISYVFNNSVPKLVQELENMFNTDIRFFKDYYFRIMYGQGSVFDLYDKDFKHLLSA